MKAALLAICGGLAALAAAPPALVIEDFEEPATLKKWKGPIRSAADRASHGRNGARARFTRQGEGIEIAGVPADWRPYDRLRFDLYYPAGDFPMATLRIYDQLSESSGARRDYYEADGQILLLQGWNHVEVKLQGLQAANYQRPLALDRIRRITLSMDRAVFPCDVFLDNIRLTSGRESPGSASHTLPGDAVIILYERFFQVRQVAAPGEVPEAAEVTALRAAAEREAGLLARTVDAARTQGIETIYQERHLVTADLGLRVRPLLAWFNNDAAKREMFHYVSRTCRQTRLELEGKLSGAERLPTLDDTQIGEPLIRPFPPLKGRPARGRFFRDERGEPMIVLSLHSPSRVLERYFATPRQHIESYSVGGGSRWTIEQSPVYAAFKADPDTHRVGWDGWCGHLVRDLDSMGTSKPENTVICLESPRIREAIAEYIRINTPKFHANPELLYDILAYELMYMCYCDRSQRAFRGWLAEKHGGIAEANRKWGTSYADFAAVSAPPVKGARPLPGTNRGLWYDWACFNQDRFTNHLVWVRDQVRRISPHVPLAAGGSSSMLSGTAGTAGIDEERIVNEVDDVIIHEGGASTLGMDLQLALAETRKPLADPEMSLGSVYDLLPHTLHGKSVMQLWHWPAQPGSEFHGNNRNSLAHGWRYPLADVGELLRVALDVRRLNNEMAAFAETSEQAAILYSRTATLQLPPEMLSWRTTPFLEELRNTYEASRMLDAPVTFVTERQIAKGALRRFRILLIPAVPTLQAEVVSAIWDYCSQGGRVLLVPDSLRADEYNRPAPYLDRIGISILETRGPQAGVGGLEQGYTQSFERGVRFAGSGGLVLKPEAGQPGELRTRGLTQKARAASGEVLYRYPDGSPAVWRIPLGQGAVYYSAASLQAEGYSRLLDTLFSEAGIERPVRVRGARVEARFARLGDRRLLYVINGGREPVRLTIESSGLRGVRELREGLEIEGTAIEVPARQTCLYELR